MGQVFLRTDVSTAISVQACYSGETLKYLWPTIFFLSLFPYRLWYCLAWSVKRTSFQAQVTFFLVLLQEHDTLLYCVNQFVTAIIHCYSAEWILNFVVSTIPSNSILVNLLQKSCGLIPFFWHLLAVHISPCYWFVSRKGGVPPRISSIWKLECPYLPYK